MVDKIAGHILHRDFFEGMKTFFENMSESRLNHFSVMNDVVALLNSGVIKEDNTAIANHTIPQKALIIAHADAMASTDAQLCYLAHLLKIIKFMPQVGVEFGGQIYYEAPDSLPKHVPKGEWRENIFCHQDFESATEHRQHNKSTNLNYITWDLNLFSDADYVDLAMQHIILDSYTNINSLRFMMSPSSLVKALENDYFSQIHLGERLSTAEDIAVRIELQYYSMYGQALNIFPDVFDEGGTAELDDASDPVDFILGITPESSKTYSNVSKPSKSASKPRLIR